MCGKSERQVKQKEGGYSNAARRGLPWVGVLVV